MTYAPLWTRTNYSFLEGASHPEEYVHAASTMELSAIAITDRDGLYGIVRAHAQTKDTPVPVIYGSQMTVGHHENDDDSATSIVLLSQTREGYRNLSRLVSKGRLRRPKGSSLVTWDEVCEYAEDTVALWGGDASIIADPEVDDPTAVELGGRLRDAFGDRLYAMLARHHRDTELDREVALRRRARALDLQLVAANEVLFHSPDRRPLQDVVTCIKHGVKLHEAGRLLRPNHRHVLHTPQEFFDLFADIPEAVERTREVASRCTFRLSEVRYVYPSERLPDGQTSMEWLRKLTYRGARGRFPDGVPEEHRMQIERELEIIERLDYPGYFLTMWEVVDYCRRNGILCQGRGSAANSCVCYCLGITAVDPIETDLLFERFISPERAEPPDIDLDIEHKRREEVIQNVYERYGRTHAAMVANVVRYRPRSAIREVGKVLDIPETTLDRVAKMSTHRESPSLESVTELGLDPDNDTTRLFVELTNELLEFPRHLSIHPGGFILGHEPVHDLVPIENATMEDRTVIQWDKYDVEELGLFKVDLLGLGALSHLSRCFSLVRRTTGDELSMATLPQDDSDTYDLCCEARTVGVFQIESRAQMSFLPRMRPRRLYDLVIEVAIVRPGPITGDMVHPYIRRRNGEEEVTYPHPSLEPVLAKTLGIPLFQEQVMKLAVVAADYTPGEADQLRRDMAAWRSRGRIDQHRDTMISRMTSRGIEQKFAERVFAQIQGFGEYGFPESHAASFALITYATAYMKTHYPVEFTCSLLNSQPMGFYTPATIIDDAKREGVEFFPVDVLLSDWDCTLEPLADGYAIRMGLRYLNGIKEDEWDRIETARLDGPFESIRDFVVRSEISSRTLERLAESGAFSGFDRARREALWDVAAFSAGTLPLPFESSEKYSPEFPELTPFEAIAWDYQTTFHSARGHPMQTIRQQLQERGLPDSEDVRSMPNGSHTHYAGMVICRQRPGTASGVVFITMEDENGFVNLVVWPDVFEKFRILGKTTTFLGVSGKVQNEKGTSHLIVDRMWVPDISLTPKNTGSRDFH